MKRTLLFIAIAAPLHMGAAQAPSKKLPVFPAKITMVGSFRDTTAGNHLTPWEATLSQRGTLIAYVNDQGLSQVREHTGEIPTSDAIAAVPPRTGFLDHGASRW